MKDMPIAEFANDKDGKTRDIVMIVDEAILNECNEPRQMVWFADVTVEKLPMMISNYTVKEASGNFCERGGRFGAHSSNESMAPVYYKKMAFISFFNAGVRALDIRDPYHPTEVGYFIPAITAATDKRCVKIDEQGALQGRDPDQQCRDRRARLHLHRRPRQYRPAHSRTDGAGARRCRAAMRRWPAILACVLALGALPGAAPPLRARQRRPGAKSPGRFRATAGPRAAPSAATKRLRRHRSLCPAETRFLQLRHRRRR